MKKTIGMMLGITAVTGMLAVPGVATAQTKLKYHSAFPQANLNIAARWYLDELERRLGDKIKFDRIYGGALGKLKEAPMALKARSFDIGQVSSVYNPGLYPRGTVTSLPFLSTDIMAHGKAAHDLFNSPLVEPEFKALNQKYMFNGMWISIELMSYDRAETIDDLRKMKIRAHGGAADVLKQLGITAYGIPWGELPTAAKQKVVNAGIIGVPADAYDFGFGEIFSYWNRFSWYYFPLTVVVNLDTWNSLPADVRQTMEELNADMTELGAKQRAPREMKAEKALLGGLVEPVEFKDLDKLRATAQPVWDSWVAARKKEGIDGQAILDEFRRLVKKHEKM